MSSSVDTALMTKIATAANFATHAPGGVHNTIRPQGGLYPCVVFQLVADPGSGQSYADGGVEELWYDVVVIGTVADGGQTNVGTLVEAIHAVLERGALTLGSGTHLQTMKLRRLPTRMETAGGVAYISRGYTYRVWKTA